MLKITRVSSSGTGDRVAVMLAALHGYKTACRQMRTCRFIFVPRFSQRASVLSRPSSTCAFCDAVGFNFFFYSLFDRTSDFSMFKSTVAVVTLIGAASAHIGAYHKSMFCLNGYSNDDQPNSNEVSNPLLNKTWDEFWFHGDCKSYPPAAGDFLELTAGGKATVEHAGNRGQTTLSFEGQFAGEWPDGKDHSNYEDGSWDNSCIFDPNLHAENQTRAANTVLAIAYKSDIHDVKYEDLVIISVLEHTPWKRMAEYDIPADLPACDDCVCAYSWIPNHCGIPNMYMNGMKCKVTGARSDAPKVAQAQKAKWCEGKQDDCVKGAKGITIYNQQPDINTVDLQGIYQADGQEASPGYNEKMGFAPGAQNDIFEASSGSPSTSTSTSAPEPTGECSGTNTLSTRSHSGHRRHQRRLLSFAGFTLSMDAAE
ncbi:hypothetical protein BKA62DRAFT_662307 [Auriculariales sp. MPI-PUGE-AT-0066]|nr:hypothetical protein BKA62DRAFT_662307 [Auriculariales sp. MPI-PUGE-AT-0066]